MSPDDVRANAFETAVMVVDAFSKRHPHLRMNVDEWADLKEMIDREIRGHFCRGEENLSAFDLLDRPAVLSQS
jgi:hypothetical protein